MISYGRYGYHIADIAEIKAKPLPLGPIDRMRLSQMLAEVAEYEDAHNITRTHPDQAKEPLVVSRSANPGVVPSGTICQHGNRHYCGFCYNGKESS